MLVARSSLFCLCLQGTWLCFVRGRSILDGAATILSVAVYWGVLGFLPCFDFFLAYDQVYSVAGPCSQGHGLWGLSALLGCHSTPLSVCLLHAPYPRTWQVESSIHQGDQAASAFFVIYIEPFLFCLQDFLHGLFVGGIIEASFGYMDDMTALNEDEEDIILVDGCAEPLRSSLGHP
jgi:hypothetical protein